MFCIKDRVGDILIYNSSTELRRVFLDEVWKKTYFYWLFYYFCIIQRKMNHTVRSTARTVTVNVTDQSDTGTAVVQVHWPTLESKFLIEKNTFHFSTRSELVSLFSLFSGFLFICTQLCLMYFYSNLLLCIYHTI